MLVRHPPGAMGKRDRHDHRQKFRCQPHREREREQQRIENRPVKEDVRQQHGKNEQQRDPHNEVAEIADANPKRRQRRFLVERTRDPAKLRAAPGTEDHSFGRAADNRTAHKQAGRRNGTVVLAYRGVFGALFHRIGFACEQRFIDEDVFCFDEPAVRRYQIPRCELNDIARNDAGHRNIARLAIPQDTHAQHHLLPEFFGGTLGAIFLHEIQNDGEENHGRDNGEARRIAGHRRKRGGRQQHEHQRVAKPAQ